MEPGSASFMRIRIKEASSNADPCGSGSETLIIFKCNLKLRESVPVAGASALRNHEEEKIDEEHGIIQPQRDEHNEPGPPEQEHNINIRTRKWHNRAAFPIRIRFTRIRSKIRKRVKFRKEPTDISNFLRLICRLKISLRTSALFTVY